MSIGVQSIAVMPPFGFQLDLICRKQIVIYGDKIPFFRYHLFRVLCARMGPGLWRFSSVAPAATARLRIASQRPRNGLRPLTPLKLLSMGEAVPTGFQ